MNMDSLAAIGVGLGLRALIDSVARESYQASVLVGIWEGVVLNHFISRYPKSWDPYLAYAFRLFVDLMFTESLARMLIIVLWTGLGMLLADLSIQMSADRRFRRLWRRIRRAVLPSSSGISPPSRSTRVRFFEIPGSSSTAGSRTTTAYGPESPGSSVAVPVRPTTQPLPGRFDQWSEITPSVHSGAGSDSGSVTPSEARTPRSPPPRPRTPSELEYLTLETLPVPVSNSAPNAPMAGPSRPQPTIITQSITQRRASQPAIITQPVTAGPTVTKRHVSQPAKKQQLHDLDDDKREPRSGLTTPTSNPRSPLPDEDRPRVHSGLTTPEHLHTTLDPLLPPTDQKGATHHPIRLTLANPTPPELTPVTFPEPQTLAVTFPEPQLTPMEIPPASEIPNIPTPDDALAVRADNRTPPPSFQDAMKDPSVAGEIESVADQASVIAGNKETIISKADELRKLAVEQEAERDRLRNEIKKAQKEKRFFDVTCLQVEYEEAQENVAQLHAKAARRYFKAHNLEPSPHEIDVHRLNAIEAMVQVRKAIRDARAFGAPELRIIVGKGNHSKGNVPVLKPTITSELQKLHITAVPDPKNTGVLVIKMPSGKFASARPAP